MNINNQFNEREKWKKDYAEELKREQRLYLTIGICVIVVIAIGLIGSIVYILNFSFK